ncbi:Mom family adenine methylcarbamoylation protein [Bradyrhizobium sp. AZCC 1699]|uniref:Mom family adenine methylcarbamoylation protein n=1 Tax=unclassified Bradyrhizobium TaxID=2631580 RepID=UPI003FA56DA8
MGQAKEIRVAPIAKKDADALIIRLHYSHKTVNNGLLSLGVFLDGRLEGAMTFDPSMDKSDILGLVRDTAWNGFLELNRLAFSEALPRNSESRAALDRSADDQKALSAHRMGDLVRRWMPVRRRDDLSRGRLCAHRDQVE